jgi:hypothetical protein
VKKLVIALLVVMSLLCSTVFASATVDPAVTIVSPTQTVYGNSLLVSIKMTAPKTIKVYVYEEKQKVGDTLVSIDPSAALSEDIDLTSIFGVSIITPQTFTGTGSLQFYNKQLSEVTPGLYRIKVETLGIEGTVTASSSTRVVVMPAESTTGSAIFQTQQSGAFQWVQNLLKSIFGN